jgi:hypothetical protein
MCSLDFISNYKINLEEINNINKIESQFSKNFQISVLKSSLFNWEEVILYRFRDNQELAAYILFNQEKPCLKGVWISDEFAEKVLSNLEEESTLPLKNLMINILKIEKKRGWTSILSRSDGEKRSI